MDSKEEFYVFDRTLCTKEHGKYQEVESVDYYHVDDGKKVPTEPLVAKRAQHVLLMDRKDKIDPIFAVRRIPKDGRFTGLPAAPEGYVLGEIHTRPYVLKQKKAPARKKEFA